MKQKVILSTAGVDNGFTLIELVVVIVIISLLIAFAGIELTGWMARYRAENQIKEMYTDLMDARSRAMKKNRTYFIHLSTATPTRYDTYEDTNGNNTLDIGTDTNINSLSKQNFKYSITWDGGVDPLDIAIDRRGLVAPSNRNLWVLKDDGTTYGSSEIDYDCIIISLTRINMGKYNGAICQPK